MKGIAIMASLIFQKLQEQAGEQGEEGAGIVWVRGLRSLSKVIWMIKRCDRPKCNLSVKNPPTSAKLRNLTDTAIVG
jgi:hypothetical protein